MPTPTTLHPHVAPSLSARYSVFPHQRFPDCFLSCFLRCPQYTAELKRSMREPLDAKRQAVEELLEKLALQVGVN